MEPRSRKRARTVDRDAAVELINAAYAEGQLSTSERDDRVHRALVARRVGDLEQATADLQGLPAVAPSGPAVPWWQRGSRRTKLAVAATALVLVGGGAIAVASQGDGGRPETSQDEVYVVPVTAEEVAALIADVRAEFGTTLSYGVSLQLGLSHVRVPTDDDQARFRAWRPTGDGEFTPAGDVVGAGDQREFDLADVEIAALSRNIERGWRTLGVDEPTDTVLVIDHWGERDQPTISITVINEFEESGYLITTLAGEVLERRPYGVAG